MSSEIRSTDQKKNYKNFDQTPKLTENFDQLKMSSEIRSSDRFPVRRGRKYHNNELFSRERIN
jgi:hypothetical protein